MQNKIRTRLAGTSAWTVSTGDEEWITIAKAQTNDRFFEAKVFEFLNKEDCVINVNNTQDVLIPAEYGIDAQNVTSFKIKTAGVHYTCRISY